MGKVHGQLTKAGKVRTHTPKVERAPRVRPRCGKKSMRRKFNVRMSLEKKYGKQKRTFKINGQVIQNERRNFRSDQANKIKDKRKMMRV